MDDDDFDYIFYIDSADLMMVNVLVVFMSVV